MALYKTFEQLLRIVQAPRGSPSLDKCNLVKKKARKLLLLVHPDKFNNRHPECADDVSTKATEMLSRMFVSAKSACVF